MDAKKRRTRRRGATAFLIVLAGCSNATAQPARKTFILGDSITQLARAEIHARLPGAVVSAHVGFTGKRLIPKAVDAVASHVTVLIIEAGTDDAILREADWRAVVRKLVRLSRRVGCAWFVTVAEQPAMGPIAPAWNLELRAAGVRLIDWDAALRADSGLAEPTGVHPTDAGKRWLADQYAGAVQACGS